MKLLPLFLLATLPALAQFRSIEITFEGIGCASCMESLPSRIGRLRGVESTKVDVQHSTVKIQLAEQNRVRLEQVRDMIEQDGTKAKSAVVTVKGDLSRAEGKWVLQPPALPAAYEVEAASPAAGTFKVTGEVGAMKPETGRLLIKASALTPAR